MLFRIFIGVFCLVAVYSVIANAPSLSAPSMLARKILGAQLPQEFADQWKWNQTAGGLLVL